MRGARRGRRERRGPVGGEAGRAGAGALSGLRRARDAAGVHRLTGRHCRLRRARVLASQQMRHDSSVNCSCASESAPRPAGDASSRRRMRAGRASSSTFWKKNSAMSACVRLSGSSPWSSRSHLSPGRKSLGSCRPSCSVSSAACAPPPPRARAQRSDRSPGPGAPKCAPDGGTDPASQPHGGRSPPAGCAAHVRRRYRNRVGQRASIMRLYVSVVGRLVGP